MSLDITDEQLGLISDLDKEAVLVLMQWLNQALPHQLFDSDPYITLLNSGRGTGKTKAASYWTFEQAVRFPGSLGFVIAPTQNDVRFICFEGSTGLIETIPPQFIKKYNSTLFTIDFYNGSKLRGLSAEKPSRIRGANISYCWYDELSSFQYPDSVFSQVEMALRKGDEYYKPKILISSTPKPIPLIKSLIKRSEENDSDVTVIRASSYDNPYLPQSFIEKISIYEGTNLGRQEIHAELVETSGSIFPLDDFILWPISQTLPKVEYLIDSWDTATSLKEENDYSARCRFAVIKLPDSDKHVALLVAVERVKLEYPELRKLVIERYETPYKYRDANNNEQLKKCDLVLIESASTGIALHQDLARSRKVRVKASSHENKDKIQRARLTAPLVNLGYVYLVQTDEKDAQGELLAKPHKAYYNSGFIAEVTEFPNQAVEFGSLDTTAEPHDDMTDAFVYGLSFLRGFKGDGWLKLDLIPEIIVDDVKRHNYYAAL